MAIRDELVRLATDLIAIPSVSDYPGSRAAVIDYVEAFCSTLPGVHTQRHASGGTPSLVAAFDAERHKALVLNAHLDVVPGRPEQFEPFERDGRIYGRGAQDMKGAAAAFLLVLKNLAEVGERPGVSWQFVTDEEIGGEHGTSYLLRNGYTADFFVAGEPTDLEIVNRAKGFLWLTVHQQGNPAHGSRPWDGSNPIAPLAAGITRLLERWPIPEEPVWQTTVTPTVIHGGDAHNRVPAGCTLRVDIRVVPEDSPEAIQNLVSACFEGAGVEVYRSGPALSTPEDDPHIRRLARLVQAGSQREAVLKGEHFFSDARFCTELGISAVCFGPAGRGLHSDEEWVDVARLERYYQLVYDLARSYQG